MSTRVRILAIVFCLSTVWPPSSHAGGAKLEEKVYIRGAAVGARWELSNFEEALDRDQALLEAEGIVPTYEKIEPAYGFALEGGVRMSSMWSVGLAYSYERKTFSNSAEGIDTAGAYTNIADEYTLGIWEMAVNVSFWIPFAPGLYLGASGGLAGGLIEESLTIETESEGVVSAGTGHGEYDNADPVAGIFAGFQYEFESSPLIYLEVGYRLRNLGALEGEATGSEDVDVVKPDGELTDLAGVRVGDIDFTGLYGRVGLGFSFE